MRRTSGLRRAIVHVGLPRTGTTTLQRVLFGMRPQLLAQGILYPELAPYSATDIHLSHQYLGEVLDGRRPRHERTELLGALAAQLATTPADTVLVSYEGLCLASPWLGVPQRLAELFRQRGFAMEVLVTLKPQDELANSTYTWRTQFLREARRFHDFFHAEIGRSRLDLGRLLRSWRAACDDRMLAVATRDPRSGRPLVERIFAEMGILPRVEALLGAEERGLVENRSPGPVAVEVSRQLRRRGAHAGLGRTIRDVTRFVEDAARARGVNAVPFMGLDRHLRVIAADRWAVANDRFARQVWNEPWANRVVALPDTASNEIARSSQPDAASRDVDDILYQTCERFQIRLADGFRLAMRDRALSASTRLGRLVGRAAAF